jgi:hypothetical protein
LEVPCFLHYLNYFASCVLMEPKIWIKVRREEDTF